MLKKELDKKTEFSNSDLFHIYKKLSPKLQSDLIDSQIHNFFGDFLLSQKYFDDAKIEFEKSLKIFVNPINYYKVWECLTQEGHVSESNKYALKYLDYLFKFKRHEKIKTFLKLVEQSGLDRETISLLKIRHLIMLGDISSFSKGLRIDIENNPILNVEIAYELLKKRKYWKFFNELQDELFELFIELIPVDFEEEKIIRRQLLEIILNKLVKSEYALDIRNNVEKYKNKFKSNNVIPVLIDAQNISDSVFLDIEQNKMNALYQHMEELISSREFVEARYVLDELMINGFNSKMVERAQRQIKLHEESFSNDVTVIGNNLLNEIQSVAHHNETRKNSEDELFNMYFKNKFKKLKNDFTFEAAREIFYELGILDIGNFYKDLVNVCKENYSKLSDSEGLELEYVYAHQLFYEKKYHDVIGLITNVMKSRPLSKKEKIMFLILKKRAYRKVSKLTDVDDVEKLIKYLNSENA